MKLNENSGDVKKSHFIAFSERLKESKISRLKDKHNEYSTGDQTIISNERNCNC